MEFPFPPLPPEYFRLMAARWLCVGWNLLALYWLVGRVRRRKEVRATDAVWWYGVAVVGLVLVGYGTSYRSRIGNEWLEPLGAASLSVAIAGATLSFIKVYEQQRWGPFVAISLVYGVSLAWLFLPTFHCTVGGESSKRTQCKNQLKQIGLALHNYHDTFSVLPAPTFGQPPVSWRVTMLPYMDQSQLHATYNHAVAWDQTPNGAIPRMEMVPYRCPSNELPQDALGRWFTAYSMPTGPKTVGANPKGTKIANIADGTSNTLLVVEACGAQIFWTEPRDVDVGVQPTGINLKGNASGHSAGWLSSYHARGTQVLLADGSVRFLSAQTDPAVLKKLATVDGGELVGDF